MPELLAELTLLVHPARQEPLGRVLLEAAAAGVPVVATDVGGTREIFSDDEAELIVPDDVAALAAAIERMLADESLRRRRGAAASRAFEKRSRSNMLPRHLRGIIARLWPLEPSGCRGPQRPE